MTEYKDMQVTGVVFRKPNRNGRIYSPECFDTPEIRMKINEGKCFVTFPAADSFSADEPISLNEICGVVRSLSIDGEALKIDFTIIDDLPGAEIANRCLEAQAEVLPRGIGQVDSNGVVTDYSLVSFEIYRPQK